MLRFIILLCIQFAIFECLILYGTVTKKMYPKPPQIIEHFGYPVETHLVTTKDGYILTIYRIPYGKKCGPEKRKGVVFLQHGFLASSADWVILGPKKGFAFTLADACYDVWIMNSRGTDYSQGHVSLNANVTPGPYWDFDWHEMGIYDLPAVADYILGKTGVKKLFYIGHSQGTTQFYVSNIFHQDLNNKFHAAFHLAPIVYLQHSTNLFLQTLSKAEPILRAGRNSKFATNEGILGLLNDLTCRVPIVCTNAVFFEGGYDATQIERDDVPIITNYAPASASTGQPTHYFQFFNLPFFRQYDYGPDKNIEKYGSLLPPDYDLSKINVPIYAYIGPSDTLTQPLDRDRLFDQLGNNLKKVTIIDHAPWDHNDFLYAKDGEELCHVRVFGDMEEVRAGLGENEI